MGRSQERRLFLCCLGSRRRGRGRGRSRGRRPTSSWAREAAAVVAPGGAEDGGEEEGGGGQHPEENPADAHEVAEQENTF